ncbi:unnamed protein product [Peniophora sp. CBMAI 1063]|nr:unnamed protein product [Peniophora sp. CBMAI 1063]
MSGSNRNGAGPSKAIGNLAKKPDASRGGAPKLKFVPTLPGRRKKEEVKQASITALRSLSYVLILCDLDRSLHPLLQQKLRRQNVEEEEVAVVAKDEAEGMAPAGAVEADVP